MLSGKKQYVHLLFSICSWPKISRVEISLTRTPRGPKFVRGTTVRQPALFLTWGLQRLTISANISLSLTSWHPRPSQLNCAGGCWDVSNQFWSSNELWWDQLWSNVAWSPPPFSLHEHLLTYNAFRVLTSRRCHVCPSPRSNQKQITSWALYASLVQ